MPPVSRLRRLLARLGLFRWRFRYRAHGWIVRENVLTGERRGAKDRMWGKGNPIPLDLDTGRPLPRPRPPPAPPMAPSRPAAPPLVVVIPARS